MRLGYEFSYTPTTITSGTTSVTARLRLYVGTRRSVSDSTNTFSRSGGWGSSSGSVSINHTSSSEWSSANVTQVYNGTISVPLSRDGIQYRSFAASLSGINAVSGTASVSGQMTIPRRPYDPPNPPVINNTSYNGAHQAIINWDNNATAIAPYSSQRVQRWDNITGEYRVIATVGGNVSGYVDNTLVGNARYMYSVRAFNSAGDSTSPNGPYISTFPAAPSNTSVVKSAGNIIVSWQDNTRANSGFEIQRSANGGAFGTTIIDAASPWTHTSPSALSTWKYRIRARSQDAPYTYSAWVETATVQLAAPPNAPTNLAPTGVVDAAEPVVFTWRHNPVDSSDQVQYNFRYRRNGGSWVSSTVSTSTQSRTFSSGTFNGGDTVEWEVRTRGTHATFSPYSQTQTLTVSSIPLATATPVPGGAISTSRFLGLWNYYDPEGTAQSGWQVRLTDMDTSQTLREVTGTGISNSYQFPNVLTDGGSYLFEVRVQDGDGLWSVWDSTPFTVAYAKPPKPSLSGEFNPDGGSMELVIENPIPTGAQEEAVYNNVYRLVDNAWRMIASQLEPNLSFSDHIPFMGGLENIYMVEAVSALDSSEISDMFVISADPEGCDEWVWMNGGTGWGTRARVRGNLDTSVSRSRQKTLRRYVGRAMPLEFSSEWVEHTLSLSGSTQGLEHNDEESWLAVADLYAPVCYRDMFGRRLFVSVEKVDLGQSIHKYQDLSVEMTEVYSEGAEGELTTVGYPPRLVLLWRDHYNRALSMNDPDLVDELSTYAGWSNWYLLGGGFDE